MKKKKRKMVNIEDNNGHNLSFYCAICGAIKCLKLIKDYIDFDKVDKNGDSLLHLASKLGYLECVKLILEVSGETLINLPNYKNFSPLYYACVWGTVDITILLIENGASMMFKQNDFVFFYIKTSYDCFFSVFAEVVKLLPSEIEKTKKIFAFFIAKLLDERIVLNYLLRFLTEYLESDRLITGLNADYMKAYLQIIENLKSNMVQKREIKKVDSWKVDEKTFNMVKTFSDDESNRNEIVNYFLFESIKSMDYYLLNIDIKEDEKTKYYFVLSDAIYNIRQALIF